MKTALFITRAQPFHMGHLKVIKWILKKCDRIIIVIGSSQESKTDKNPFTIEERKEMINKTLKNEKIKNYRIIEIPDVYDDEIWVKSILKKAKFNTVFTMNSWVKRCFEKFDVSVKKHPMFDDISATKIRNEMRKSNEWKNLVPKEVVKIIERHSI